MDLAHPLFIQFKEQEAGLRAKQEYQVHRKREDDGGNRTLKFEYSRIEFKLEKGESIPNRGLGPRISTIRGLEWFVQPCWVERKMNGVDVEFDVFNTAAEDWPMNKGRPARKFCGGKSGTSTWSN